MACVNLALEAAADITSPCRSLLQSGWSAKHGRSRRARFEELAPFLKLLEQGGVPDRLTKRDWIRHGLVTLAKEGPDKLKIATMSSRLNVSRGSFYWHFRDAADFRDQILRRWQDRTTEQVVRDLEADLTNPDRLRALLHRAFGRGLQLDRAIRSWATQDAEVAAVVASVDGRRISYVAGLIAVRGVDESRALTRATMLYWAYLGQAEMLGKDYRQLASSAIDEIAALFTCADPASHEGG